MLKTYDFLSKKYYLWASFFQLTLSRFLAKKQNRSKNLLRIKKKSRPKILKIRKVRDDFRKFSEFFLKIVNFRNFLTF